MSARFGRVEVSRSETGQEALLDDCRLNEDTTPLSTGALETRIQTAFERTRGRIFSERFVPCRLYPRNAFPEPALTSAKIHINHVVLSIESLPRQDSRRETQQEAYELDISDNGDVSITAHGFAGAVWALETFAQLFLAHSEPSQGVYMPYAPIHIADEPLFAHRGLNLDISRNRIFPSDVMRTIEGMSMNKMNRLHIHATDSQSWPIQVPSLPELAAKGSYHDQQIWSVVDLAKVQQRGKDRGVEVFLEVDMPGHTGSIHHAYPELIAAYDMRPWEAWAQQPPSGQLKLNSPDVFKFLETLFDDVFPRISPFTTHFHVGGDEVCMKAFELDETVRSSSPDIVLPHLQKFFDRVFAKIETHSLTPLAWEEVVLEYAVKVPENAIIQSWRSQESLAKIVAKGHKALFGPHQSWYLDAGFGSWLDANPSNPNSSIKRPFLDWNSPYKSWRHVYTYDPFEGILKEQRGLIVGGEVHLWCEQTDSITLDFKLWPRVAAAAEVLWKGAMSVDESVTRRLAEMRQRLVLHGIKADMVQMEWCLQNEGGCLL
jgi:hexosaminidase